MIKCEFCGSNYSKNIDRWMTKQGLQEKEYYNCSVKKQKGIKYCKSVNLKLEEVEQIVNEVQRNFADIILKRAFPLLQRYSIIETINEARIEYMQENRDKALIELNENLIALQNKYNKLVDYFLDADEIDDFILEKKKSLEDKIKKTKNEIAVVEGGVEEYKKKINDFYKAIEKINIVLYELYRQRLGRIDFNFLKGIETAITVHQNKESYDVTSIVHKIIETEEARINEVARVAENKFLTEITIDEINAVTTVDREFYRKIFDDFMKEMNLDYVYDMKKR